MALEGSREGRGDNANPKAGQDAESYTVQRSSRWIAFPEKVRRPAFYGLSRLRVWDGRQHTSTPCSRQQETPVRMRDRRAAETRSHSYPSRQKRRPHFLTPCTPDGGRPNLAIAAAQEVAKPDCAWARIAPILAGFVVCTGGGYRRVKAEGSIMSVLPK